MHRGQFRLAYLDGLRGVAIFWVLLWHLFGATYAAFLPFGQTYSGLAIVRYGWMGVEFFFLISGFVIFMTVERCSGFRDFMLRRWLRLFPAMLITTLSLFAIDQLLHMPGPDANARAIDLLPGLTFINPAFYHALLHVPVRSIDNVYWTLYVEAAFYVVFGLLYFRFGWRTAVGGLVALALIHRLLRFAAVDLHMHGPLSRIWEPMDWAGVPFFCWFASGATFYRAYQDKSRTLFVVAILIGLLAAFLFQLPFGVAIDQRAMLIAIVLAFAAMQALPALHPLLANRIMLFVGFISYPLYLVHSNLGVALTARFAAFSPTMPPVIAVLPALAIVFVLAWLVARFAEPWLTGKLRGPVDRLRAATGIRPS